MKIQEMMKQKIKGKEILTPSTEEYKKQQVNINKKIKTIVKHYERSVEEASKYYVR